MDPIWINTFYGSLLAALYLNNHFSFKILVELVIVFHNTQSKIVLECQGDVYTFGMSYTVKIVFASRLKTATSNKKEFASAKRKFFHFRGDPFSEGVIL